MLGVTFDGKLNASLLDSGGYLFMASIDGNKASFDEVDLSGAKVTEQVGMVGASFSGTLNANRLQVGGNLLMRSDAKNEASFKHVDLERREDHGTDRHGRRQFREQAQRRLPAGRG